VFHVRPSGIPWSLMRILVLALAAVLAAPSLTASAEPPRCKPPRIAHGGECLYPDAVEAAEAAARDKRVAAAKARRAKKPVARAGDTGASTSSPDAQASSPSVERQAAHVSQVAPPADADPELLRALRFDWLDVPAGAFAMGSRWGEPDEQPERRVLLDAYRLARTETTVAQYKACVDAGWCKADMVDGEQLEGLPWRASRHCNASRHDRMGHPMNCVSWWEAVAFCEWVGGRLPTEAEWEKAATGGERMYPWGDTPPTCTHATMNVGEDGCGAGGTSAVCERPQGQTPSGACDMAGNVWEWVSDWYGAGYYAAGEDSAPTGPEQGTGRVRRGGSFRDGSSDLRSTNRWHLVSVYRSATLGFRCAADRERVE
jgi:formylglycine-generating enzyme required for sulfatase activity